MQIEDIKKLIEQGMEGAQVEVDGDGTHFAATVVSDLFAGKSMVQQHQLVYKTLGDKMGGEIHALSIQTFTPEEWEKKQAMRIN